MVYQYLMSHCPQSKKICDWEQNVKCTSTGGTSPGTGPAVDQPPPPIATPSPPQPQPPVDMGTAPQVGQLSG